MKNKIPMTAEGYNALEAELKYCREVERPRINSPDLNPIEAFSKL